MPTYDYICGACKHHTEIFHSMADSPRRKCPKCSKLKLVRQIGMGGGVIFKGTGFYETDYRSESYKKGEGSAKAEGKAKDKTEAKKSSPSDSESKPS